MNEKLNDALNEISDKHIDEAAKAKPKRKRRFFFGAVAAILAIVIISNIGFIPGIVRATTVSAASGTQATPRPDSGDYKDIDQWRTDFEAWGAERDQRQADAASALSALTGFFTESAELYLIDAGSENRVWSPVNAYIALAMLAEVTNGNSRQQILDALNTADLDTLRTQVGAVWESTYRDNGNEICLLANSLWLNKDLTYDQNTMDTLAHDYYASVYQTDLNSKAAANALQTWLNNNTGGLLKKNTANAGFPHDAVLTLASTVYLQAKWSDEFSASKNTVDVFHAPSGDTSVTFMNKKGYQTYYYWGESYGAVALGMKNGCKMWFILPDEDKTVDDVLRDGAYLATITQKAVYEDTDSQKYMKVNLSVPKFDVSSGADLKTVLQAMGITDIFSEYTSDFTAITSDSPVVITAVNQAARVIIDEQGVKAASYIEIPGAGAAMPPEEIIDFILDRPFLFVIATSDCVPLFTGVVNQP